MRIYLAGLYAAGISLNGRLFVDMMNDTERNDRLSIPYLLESYHYVNKQSYVEKITEDGTQSVFLDSGAFSAHTLGKEINLARYCQYIKDNAGFIQYASVLDGIGDPFKTYQNQKVMEAMGVKALPCFHFGEDERYLEYYIDNYNYITLGGMVPHSTPENKKWLDRIWKKYICNSDGVPRVKVHGFGLTSLPLMARYPWYSVDSSRWIQVGYRGGIVTEEWGNVWVSSDCPSRKTQGQHYNTYPAVIKKRINEYVESRGYTIERMSTVYISRWVFNMKSFVHLQEKFTKEVLEFKDQQDSLF